ncbi:MAG: MYXO-CTERM domain-containing protein [Cocleimonas sp.]|jgi:MYXO-CTERM domain-containing protein
MKKLLLGMALLLFSLSSHAALITFNLIYTSNTTAATGSGFITIDDAVFSNVTQNLFNTPAATLGITDFSITISGAANGNGTFGLADVPSFIWTQSGPYDLTTELLTQAAYTDFNLNTFPPVAGSPFGTDIGTITTNFGGSGDGLILSSMTPGGAPAPTSIPTLSFWGLGLLVLLLPLVARRRMK